MFGHIPGEVEHQAAEQELEGRGPLSWGAYSEEEALPPEREADDRGHSGSTVSNDRHELESLGAVDTVSSLTVGEPPAALGPDVPPGHLRVPEAGQQLPQEEDEEGIGEKWYNEYDEELPSPAVRPEGSRGEGGRYYEEEEEEWWTGDLGSVGSLRAPEEDEVSESGAEPPDEEDNRNEPIDTEAIARTTRQFRELTLQHLNVDGLTVTILRTITEDTDEGAWSNDWTRAANARAVPPVLVGSRGCCIIM